MKNFKSPKTRSSLNNFLIKNKDKNIVFLAGGTDLLVEQNKYHKADIVVDLTGVKELKKIEVVQDKVILGSTCTMAEISEHRQLKKIFPLLIKAAKMVGSPQIRNRATIGGNIANASPAGDTIPCLSVAKAKISFFNLQQEKIQKIALNKFFFGPGKTVLAPGDYIINFEIEKENLRDYDFSFHKVGQRKSLAISKLTVACLYKKSQGELVDISLATGSVAPTVKRLVHAENYILNNYHELDNKKLAQIVKKSINPITDIRSTGEYREFVTTKLIKKCIKQITT